MCYSLTQSRPDTHLKEEPHTTGKPPRPDWRTQRLILSQRPSCRPTAQATDAISSSQGPGYSFPCSQVMEGPSTPPGRLPTGMPPPGLRSPYRARLPRRHSPCRRTYTTRHWRDRAIVPSRDSKVVTIGELRFTDDGLESALPSTGVINRCRWTGSPAPTPSRPKRCGDTAGWRHQASPPSGRVPDLPSPTPSQQAK